MNEQSMSRRAFVAGTAGVASIAAMGAYANVGGAQEVADAQAPDWLGEAPQIDDVAETVDCEILVVGGGTGGLVATATAAELGADVLCIEKFATGGGVRNDLGSIGSRYQKEYGCEIDPLDMLMDMTRYADGQLNQRLFLKWAAESGEVIDWYGDILADAGVELMLEAATEDPERKSLVKHWPTGHHPQFPRGENGPLMDGATILTEYAEARGARFMYETPMVRLVQDADGRVNGAIAERDDRSHIQINASKGVIVCTGGYARNKAMMSALQPFTLDMTCMSTAIPGTTGDGIKACLWAGAAMDNVHSSMLFDRGVVKPDQTGGNREDGDQCWMMSYPWLKVNLRGERFCNEGGGVYDFVLHAAMSQPGKTYCSIWDANWEEYADRADMHGCVRLFPFENGAAPTFPLERIKQLNQELVDNGYIQQADSLEELAEKLGLPVETFVATVERYNDLYDAGFDEDFGKEAFRMQRVDTPPFFGVRQSGRMLCTMDGIVIDDQCRAQRPDGTAIEGLYVVGNDSGCYYANSYPNQSTGNAAGRTITFARSTARSLAAR